MKYILKLIHFVTFSTVFLSLILAQVFNLALTRLIDFVYSTILSSVASDDKRLLVDNSIELSKFLTTVDELMGDELLQRRKIMTDWRQQVNKESRKLALRNEKEYIAEPIIRYSPLRDGMGVPRKKVSFSDLLEQNNENTPPICAPIV